MHIMELLGKSRVRVAEERVLEAGQPLIEWCPLFDKVRGIKEVTAEAAGANMEFRIAQHGMFAPAKAGLGAFVGFGGLGVDDDRHSSWHNKRGSDGLRRCRNCDNRKSRAYSGDGRLDPRPGRNGSNPRGHSEIDARQGHVLSPAHARIDQLAEHHGQPLLAIESLPSL